MIMDLSPLLAFERHPGTQELAERAGLALYPCPLPALLTEIGCKANRARFRAAQKARDTLTQRIFEECRGCPGVVGLARGRRRRASRQIDNVLTAGQAAGMVGWPDVGTAATRLHAAGVEPIERVRGHSACSRARRNLYARADIERLIAERACGRTATRLEGPREALRRDRIRARAQAMASIGPDEMLSDEIAKLAGYPAGVYRGIANELVRQGMKPVRSIPWKFAREGKRYVFLRTDVLAWLERRRARAARHRR
jgi:hypothetical protein